MTRHQSEVDQLDSRPDQVVGLQRWNVDVLELLLDLLATTSFGHCHESEEGSETDGCEDQLIKRSSLSCCYGARSLGKRENAAEEAEPLVLDGGHDKTVCHESCQSVELVNTRELLYLLLVLCTSQSQMVEAAPWSLG